MKSFERPFTRNAARIALLVVAVILGGCAETVTAPALSPDAAANFALADVNPASVTFGRSIAVRDYEGWVSAWYFGHAT
jgi:hypothetical protein